MAKPSFNTLLKQLLRASAVKPSFLQVPAMQYLAVDGTGDPNTSKDFQLAIQALYGAAYTIKFTLKFARKGPEYKVPPLDSLWWVTSGSFEKAPKRAWRWRLLLLQPDHVTKADLAAALKKVAIKHPSPALKKVKLVRFAEGRCAQLLHIGPYNAEKPTILRLHAFIKEQGLTIRGKHHEVYLGDPRRTAPAKLKTIIRYPVGP